MRWLLVLLLLMPALGVGQIMLTYEAFQLTQPPQCLNCDSLARHIQWPAHLDTCTKPLTTVIKILVDAEGNYINHEPVSVPDVGAYSAVEMVLPDLEFKPGFIKERRVNALVPVAFLREPTTRIKVSPLDLVNQKEVRKSIGYPPIAQEARIKGVVGVRVRFTPSGSYQTHQVIVTPHPILSAAVEQHIHKLRAKPNFNPTICDVPFYFGFPDDRSRSRIMYSGNIEKILQTTDMGYLANAAIAFLDYNFIIEYGLDGNYIRHIYEEEESKPLPTEVDTWVGNVFRQSTCKLKSKDHFGTTMIVYYRVHQKVSGQ